MFLQILNLLSVKIIFNNFAESFNNWIDTYLNQYALSLGCYLIFFFLILLAIGAYLIISGRSKKMFDWANRHLSILGLIIWFIGVLVYLIGFYRGELAGLAIIPRAIVSSFRMFVVSNDLARVDKLMQEDVIYMVIFSLTHFAAALISFLFIFRMVGYKIKSSFNIIHYNRKYAQGKDLHLFWGVNEASCLMAEDISRTYSNQTIIFIDVDKDNGDNTQKKATLSYITNTITIKSSDIVRLDAIGALIDHCYNGPAGLNKEESEDIFRSLRLSNIGEIVRKSKSARFYFLSDDEVQNINGALNMQLDQKTASAFTDKSKIEIYVHARKSANNEVFDHYSQYNGKEQSMKIKIVDSAYLSIAELKQSKDDLPVNCVKFDKKTGLVESPFNALVVGFGETGQEAFKFLYEFSAFIDPSNMCKTKFRCYAIDDKMDHIAGLVRAKMPAITDNELSLSKISVDSEEFWEKVATIIKELNYVVITLNDDNLGLSLGVNLFKYALQHRDSSQPMLKIMVRCYEKSNEKRFTEVIKHLNNSTCEYNVRIERFGEKKKIYTCRNIIQDAILESAKEFNRVYYNSSQSSDDQWEENFGEEAISKTMSKHKLSRFHAIYDINRRIEQNISNALHCQTKMILMGFEDTKPSTRLQSYYDYANAHIEENTRYSCDPADEQLLQNIAMVEHERWIASHKLMGYTYGPQDNLIKKQRNCICRWSELKDEQTKSYDCKVVDTTIKLAYKEATKD